jgi:hypothetical protein
MGATESNRIASRRNKNNGRGSVNNTSRLSKFTAAKEERANTADWSGADPRWLAALVVAATRQSMEIAFVLSKDMGAHGLKLYDFTTGERAVLWANGDADLNAFLESVYNQITE